MAAQRKVFQREISALKQENAILRKQLEEKEVPSMDPECRDSLQPIRQFKFSDINTESPDFNARNIIRHLEGLNEMQRVKLLRPLFEICKQISCLDSKTKREIYSVALGESYHGSASAIAAAICMRRQNVYHETEKSMTYRKWLQVTLSAAIDEFLRRECNSHHMPDKKYNPCDGRPIVFLVDTMYNLWLKFLNQTWMNVSLSTFCANRDAKTIYLSRYLKRRVCLCIYHENITLLLRAIPEMTKSTRTLVSLSDKEIFDIIHKLDKDTVFPVSQWGKDKITGRLDIFEQTMNSTEIEDLMKSMLGNFREHVIRMDNQNDVTKFVLDNFGPNGFVLHVDYAENWKTKYMDEVHGKYYHDVLVTVKSGMLYMHMKPEDIGLITDIEDVDISILSEEEEVPLVELSQDDTADEQSVDKSSAKVDKQTKNLPKKKRRYYRKSKFGTVVVAKAIAGITDVLSHRFPTTLGFFFKIFEWAKQWNNNITKGYIKSDSPLSQYRNKYCLTMILLSKQLFDLDLVWDFLETGHGKGACDGVGGAIKSRGDRLAKLTGSIKTAHELFDKMKETNTNVKLFYLTQEEWKDACKLVDAWECTEYHGVSQAHQVWSHHSRVFMAKMSHYCATCWIDGKKNLKCPGWWRADDPAKTVHITDKQQTESEDEGNGIPPPDDEPLPDHEIMPPSDTEASFIIANTAGLNRGPLSSEVYTEEWLDPESEEVPTREQLRQYHRRRSGESTRSQVRKRGVDNSQASSSSASELPPPPDTPRTMRKSKRLASKQPIRTKKPSTVSDDTLSEAEIDEIVKRKRH